MKIIVYLFTFCLLSAQASELVDSLKSKIGNTQYGEQLLSFVDLMQDNQVGEIIKILKDVLKGLEADQNADNMEISKRTTEFTQSLQALEANLESLNKENQNNNQSIVDLSEQIAQLTTTVQSLKGQLKSLNDREQQYRETRSQQETAFNQKRQKGTNQIVQSIDQIIKKLSDAVLNKSFAQMNDSVNQVKEELGKDHPIALLIQTTSKFDEKTVKMIIEKLEDLRQSIVDSQQQDSTNEEQSKASFNTLINEISEIRDKFSADGANSVLLLKQKQLQQQGALKSKDDIQIDIEATNELILINRSRRERMVSTAKVVSQKRQAEPISSLSKTILSLSTPISD